MPLESLDYHMIILLAIYLYSIPAAPEAAISAKEEVLLCLESPFIVISLYCWSIYLFYTCSSRCSNLSQGRGATMPEESLDCHFIILVIYLSIIYLQLQKQQSQPRKRCCYAYRATWLSYDYTAGQSIYLFYTCSPRCSNLSQWRGAAMPEESLDCHFIILVIYLSILYLQLQRQQSQPRKKMLLCL